jgi:hypothetical protein
VINVRCFEEANGRVMLNCDGGWKPYEYSLNGEATWEPLPASQIVGDLGPGSYQIAVRASNGQCVDTASFVITEPAKLDTAGMTIQQATCGEANGAVSVTAVGGSQPYTYKWFSNDNLVTTGAKADSLASGIYGLQIEDQHGCVKRVNTIGVENTRAPVLSEVDAGVVTCSGYEDGSITFSVEEGIPPFTITCYSKSGEVADQLSAGETGDFTCDSLASGSYTIEVTDAMDCHTYQTVTIGSKAALQLNTYKTRPTCHGYNDGSIRLSAAGANGGYQYNWSDGYTGYLRDRLSADSFKVSVVDSLGCSRDFSFYLDQPEKVSVDLGEDAIICGGMEYSLHPEGYNTYYWQQDGEVIAQTPSVSLDEAGTYTLEVTDEKGCAGRDTFNLEVDNDLLRADFIIPTEAQAGDTLAGIDISNPEPDSVYWHFEGSPTVFDWEASESNPYTRFIRYSDTGRFDVALFSMKAQCRDSVVKTVHILPDSENQDDKKLLGAKPDLIETFHVFPNPNNGEFSVRVELTKKADITLDMISSQRNQLIDRKILSGLKNYKLQYSFAGLTPGVYILNLQVRDKQRAIQVIIT